MTIAWNQPRRLAVGTIVFLRCRVVNPDFIHPFQRGKYVMLELIDKQQNPVSGVQHVVEASAPITVAEAIRSVQGV